MAIHFDLDDYQFLALMTKMEQDITDGLFAKTSQMVMANTKAWLQLYDAELEIIKGPQATNSKPNWRLKFENEGAGLAFKLKWL